MTAIKTQMTVLPDVDPELDPQLSRGTDILYGGPDSYDWDSFDAADPSLYPLPTSGDGDVDGADFLVWQRDVGPVQEVDPGIVFGLLNPIYGTRWADNIYGTESNDLIYAYSSNDFVSGQGGNDVIYGGTGNDYLWGDYREGMAGGWGGDNENPGAGDPGDDILYGGAGDDILEGGPGDDMLHGGDGDDFLLGGLGANEMWGGAGADKFHTIGGQYLGHFDAGPDIVHDAEAIDEFFGTAWAVVGSDTLVFNDAYDVLFVLENYDANVEGITLFQ